VLRNMRVSVRPKSHFVNVLTPNDSGNPIASKGDNLPSRVCRLSPAQVHIHNSTMKPESPATNKARRSGMDSGMTPPGGSQRSTHLASGLSTHMAQTTASSAAAESHISSARGFGWRVSALCENKAFITFICLHATA